MARASSPRAPGRRERLRQRLPARRPQPAPSSAPAPPADQVDVGWLRSSWRTALDAAATALAADTMYLPAQELHERRARLELERQETRELLRALARDRHAVGLPVHPLMPPDRARRLLRLPNWIRACVFNLDGVLIGSAAVHAAAWRETFNEFVERRGERTHGRFAYFDLHADYYEHIHGRPRLEGVRSFLASRGISLPEGYPHDPPGAETVHGLANRKKVAFDRLLDQRRLDPYEGAHRYLELARDAHIRCAVVSASAHTDTILARTGLAPLVDAKVDAGVITAEHLRGRPAPDRILAAARLLGVPPGNAAVFETSVAGVAAGRAGGFRLVVAVDRAETSPHADALRAEGADVVVSDLADLLEP